MGYRLAFILLAIASAGVSCDSSSSSTDCLAITTNGDTRLNCGCGVACANTGLQVHVDQGNCGAHTGSLRVKFQNGDSVNMVNNGAGDYLLDYYIPWPSGNPGATATVTFGATGEGGAVAEGETMVTIDTGDLVMVDLIATCSYALADAGP